MKRTRTLLTASIATMLALALTGCSSLIEQALTVVQSSEEMQAGAGALRENGSSDQSTRSERGHIVKQVGEPIEIVDDATQESVLTFVVSDIVVDPVCEGEHSGTPTNGVFLQVDIDVVATSEFEGYFIIGVGGNWQWVDTKGNVTDVELGSFEAYLCQRDEQRLPVSVEQGEHVTGSLILDVTTREGTLVYADHLGSGWEWEVPVRQG